MKTNICAIAAATCVVTLSSAGGADSASTATGISRSFNPAISSNGLFIASYDSEDGGGEAERDEHAHGPRAGTGLRVQEFDLQMSAVVDPYLRADLTFAVPGGEGFELEEGYLTSQGLPVTLKMGRFLAEFGRHNLLHAHQFPFLDAPLVHDRLLGDAGLVDTGISGSWLLPLPWFAEVSAQVLNGDGELFASHHGEDLLYLGHLKHFLDLSDASTLELGASAVTGANSADELTSIFGGDLTFKWRAARTRNRSLVWQSEYVYARHNTGGARRKEGGLYTLAQFQIAPRWWIQGRYDLFGVPEEDERESRISGLLAFVASEFSAIRLQYTLADEEGESVHQVLAQLNFTIGAHPAHRY